jgi:mono/diheme cytochrome c family protein
MTKTAIAILILSLLFLTEPAVAGGWVTITLDELPSAVRAGEPVALGFMVRQHGVHPIDGVEVVVCAEHLTSGERLEWTADKGKETGYFTAEVVFPQPGEWVWRVTAEPFTQTTELPPLNVLPVAAADTSEAAAGTNGVLLRVAGVGLLALGALLAVVQRRRPGLLLGLGGGLLLLLALVTAPPPAPAADAAPPAQSPNQTPAEVGAALFQAKGCVTCHRHEAVPATGSLLIGPDLSGYVPEPEFVRAWLRDPAAVRPNTPMPNLELSDAEIEALLAFLTDTRKPTDAEREACPVTTAPAVAFRPPEPYPAEAPYEGEFWYGTPALWTMLPVDGRWDQLAHGEKVWWWRDGYNGSEEAQPELRVTARRLDAVAPVAESGPPATNGYHRDFHWAMLVGLRVATSGCWEVTGHYHGEELSFVVWVAP